MGGPVHTRTSPMSAAPLTGGARRMRPRPWRPSFAGVGTGVCRCWSWAPHGAPGACRSAPPAYLRLRLPADATVDQVRGSLAAVEPEPDFPTTSAGGIGPRLVRLMRRRLGATAVLSNLGRIEGPVDSIAMFPACSGPRALVDRAGVHVEHDHAEPADPASRLHGRRTRPAARRPRGRVLRGSVRVVRRVVATRRARRSRSRSRT